MSVLKKWALIMFLLLAYPGIALAEPEAGIVEMKLEQTNYYIDAEAHELQAAPFVHEGTTMVPLRVITEIFGVAVSWQQSTGMIDLQINEEESIQIDTHNNIALISKTSSSADVVTIIQDGTTLVPLRFLAQNMDYQVNYNSATKGIQIKKLPPPNQRPVALFKLPQATYAQGETIIYEDASYDPDGDAIIERKWEGREEAFFKPGEYTVSITVKDKHGEWSEPFSQVITVTDQVKMDQLTYYFNSPILGKILDITELPVLDIQTLDPLVTMKNESVLISDSPETFKRDGVLYRDEVVGNNRILYHHLNGTNQPKSVYLLAINNGSETASIRVNRQGLAGPGDPMAVGRLAAYNFLGFKQSDSYSLELEPGQKIILNRDAVNPIKPGQTVHGMFDVSSDSLITFAIVAVGKQDPINDYEQLLVLPRGDSHTRGTFQLPSRNMTLEIPDSNDEPTRLVIADGKDDTFLYGKDVTISGSNVLYTRNSGNYGVVYSITIQSQQRVALLLNPRGGIFTGAGSWDGKPFYIPDSGILQPKTQAALLGILEPGKRKVLQFIPPAGSYLPVNIVFMPF